MPRTTQRQWGYYTPKPKGDGKWKLQWPIPGITKSGKQKVKTRTFSTKAEAESAAAKVNNKFREEGFKRDNATIAGQSPAKRIPHTDTITLHEAGKLYLQAFEDALEARENRNEVDAKSKKRRANEVLASSGENTDTYVCRETLDGKYGSAINKFCSKNELGTLLLKDITVADIRMHLELLDLAISTYNDRINLFSRFFKWCMDPKRGYINASPAAGLTRLKDEWHEPEILTVDEVRRVFRAAEKIDPGLIPVLTLRAHAGLRSCEIKRMNEEDVHWKYKLIDIRKEVAKSKSPDKPLPRKIEGLPKTVWEWLASVGGENFKLDRVNLCKRILAVFKEAEVEYKKNCFRHSFCSYGFSLIGDDGKVRKWSGHRSASAFYNNYVNVSLCSKAEAIDYFAILPTANHVARLGLRRRRHQPTINWPTIEELQQLIAAMSNVKIAKKMGCTEAAVRKERKKRGI